MSNISRGFTSHHTGTVPLCSTTGATSSIDRTSMGAFLPRCAVDEGTPKARRAVPGAGAADSYAGGPTAPVETEGRATVGSVRSIVLEPEPLTHDAFEAFGWLPVADTDPRDRTYTYEFAWGDTHVNVISHAPDEIEHTAAGAICSG